MPTAFKVLLRAADFAGFVREAQQIQLFPTFGLPHQLQEDFAIPVAGDTPIRVVIADDAGEFDLERRRELEVEHDLVIFVELVAARSALRHRSRSGSGRKGRLASRSTSSFCGKLFFGREQVFKVVAPFDRGRV